jgi:hypothetical protein
MFNKIVLYSVVLLALLFDYQTAQANINLVTAGQWWHYYTGSQPDANWKNYTYTDNWNQGFAQLGFGEGDEATTLTAGASANNNYPSYYFRHAFWVNDTTSFDNLHLQVKRDDGIVVYINGTEVLRDNMPTGNITYNTWASGACADDGTLWISITLPRSYLNPGMNQIATEVHQSSATSSDLSFDLQLEGNTEPAITRGTYLQLATANSITIRWRTNIPTNSSVQYGTIANNLANTATDTATTTEHIVALNNLLPNTRYYYAVGSTTAMLQSTPDTNRYFITAPPIGTPQLTRIWATGDCGTAQSIQTKVMNAYQNFVGNQYTNLWLLLGDNAYNSGLDTEYQNKFFQPYMAGKVMAQTAIFPAPGNHDYYNTTNLNSLTTPYFQNFTIPTQAESGGIASNTEAYYSFDYANIHFISLNSYGTVDDKKLYDTTGTQAQWLKQDLLANTQKWTIVYWHHPPYTMGTHNSDSETDLVAIRSNLVKLLDQYHVDLVLCGHSHTYERSKLMKGHYGYENTFDANLHNTSSSTGFYDQTDNSCPYIKSSSNPTNEGIVYVVAGSSGKIGNPYLAFWPHNAMLMSNYTVGGSMLLEVEGNRLDAKFITENDTVFDRFTILKDVNKTTDVSPCGQAVELTASWKGNYLWQHNQQTTPSIVATPTQDTTYTVTDGIYGCLTDTFNVHVWKPTLNYNPVVCPNSTTTYNTQNYGANATYFWSVVGGVIVSGQGTPTVNISWNDGVAGSVSLAVSY